MHAGFLLASLPLGSPVSTADASAAPMGDALEADLAIRRCSPALYCRADRRLNLGSRVRMLGRSGFPLLHSLALCVLSLYKEAFGPLGWREVRDYRVNGSYVLVWPKL
ncbi:hypothetical protein D3C85_1570430 [compost metagenome]